MDWYRQMEAHNPAVFNCSRCDLFQRDQWLSDVLEMPCFRMNGVAEGASSGAVCGGDGCAAAPTRSCLLRGQAADGGHRGSRDAGAGGFSMSPMSASTLVHNGERQWMRGQPTG